ncbi:MAG: T9SS type A sorting domain-containing protein [Polaribacter sp.]|uniref:T9SS type A sorting domain-containing protein n=1 Tax=Polaribacter sp. TaxID=1920175 RepID=UPI002F359213
MLKQAQKAICIISFFWTVHLSSQSVLINENFSSGSLPAGWNNVNNGGVAGNIWEFNDPGTRNITAGNISGNYAILDSDNYGSGNNQNARLITPTFSTGIYETITLEFDYQYRDYNGGESCVVEVYNGTTWTEVFRKELGDENYVSVSSGSNLESIDITTEAGGASNAQVRFTYIGAYDWWWAIDNVEITGTSPSSINTYLGPGGVGNTDGTSSLKFWARTDLGVSTTGALIDGITNSAGVGALDISETGAQRPTLVSSAINGYDEISFSGSNRLRTGLTLTTSNFVTNQASSFVVAKADNTTQSTSVYLTDPLVSSTRFSNHLPWSGTVFYDFGACCGTSARIQVGSLTGLTSYSLWTYDANSSTGKQLYRNGTLLQNRAGVSSYTSHATQRFNLGGNTSGSAGFVGDVGEVIIFKGKLNTTQRIIVDNYLSAKFGLTLNVNDFYNEDTSGGNFDHNVAGIGRASDGSLHVDSQGTGIIRINTPSDLNNDEFLFWGEDVIDADYEFSSSLVTNYLERLDTKWRVSKRNNLGTISLAINASDITLSSMDGCNDLKLIVSSSSTFATKTTYDLVLSSGVYNATGVDFTDNDYFTLEYQDLIVLDGATAYNGAGASNKPNTNDDCYKLLVKSNTLTLSEDADVREIEVESSSILAVDSGIRLQVTNGINNNGDIRLVGTSQLVQTHTTVANLNTGSGNLHVDQTASTSSVYHSGYWSSPVSVGASYAINDVLKDGSVPTATTVTAGEAVDIDFIAGHDGSSASSPIEISTRWLAIFNNAADWTRFVSPTATVLTSGLGWNMKSVGSTFTFKGIPNDGEYSFPIAVDNYSLLGNPYPSALDAEAFITQNAGEFNGELYIYNSASDNTHVRGNYTGTYSTIVSGVSVGAGRYLPIGQAFFVTREVAGTGNITFRNSQRTLTTLSDTDGIVARNSKKRESNTSKGLPVLKIGFEFDLSNTEKRLRQVAVAFRGLTNNYDRGFDAEMWSLQPTDMYLKVNDRESPFIITGVANADASNSIPIVVQLDEQREVTFSLDEKQNIPLPVYLFDSLLNIFYDLNEIPQVINLSPGEYTDRFFITFTNKTLDTEEAILSKGFTIYNKRETKELFINNNSTSSIEKITIYNLLGQKLIEVDDALILNKKELIINTKKLRNTVYIVTIKTTEGIISKKVI